MYFFSKDAKQEEKIDQIAGFLSYEEYLDSQITDVDEYYLEDKELAREIIKLGYRNSDTLSREEFDALKKAEKEAKNKKSENSKILSSTGKDLSGSVLLSALADREELVRNGKLTCIIFIRDKNQKGQEVSGYIDYAHRLKTEKFGEYFSLNKRFMPRTSDLSYYNWDTNYSTSNSSSNFQVIADNELGLVFKNKRDHKIINVDHASLPGDNSTRTLIKDPEYAQIVIFDHMSRRKN